MKTSFVAGLVGLLCAALASATKVYRTCVWRGGGSVSQRPSDPDSTSIPIQSNYTAVTYMSGADVKVYIADYESEADLVVYRASYE